MDNDKEVILHPDEEESTHKCSQYDIFALVHHCEHHVQGTTTAIQSHEFPAMGNEGNVVLSPIF